MGSDYEFKERAAIREFDGGYDRVNAERLAEDDMRARQAEQGRLAVLTAGSYREELEAERDQVREQWFATKDPEEHQRLKQRWQELCMKIIDLRSTGD